MLFAGVLKSRPRNCHFFQQQLPKWSLFFIYVRNQNISFSAIEFFLIVQTDIDSAMRVH